MGPDFFLYLGVIKSPFLTEIFSGTLTYYVVLLGITQWYNICYFVFISTCRPVFLS